MFPEKAVFANDNKILLQTYLIALFRYVTEEFC